MLNNLAYIYCMEHFLASNIKYLRSQKDWTQADLASRLNIKRSRIGAYEEGRAEPGLIDLQTISIIFGISLDDLVGTHLSHTGLDTLRKKTTASNLRLLSVVVDKEGDEQVVVVPVKARAGYLNHYEDIDNYTELPSFQLPLPEIYSGQTHRVFQIEGDSMIPMPPGSYVLTRYVENWQNIKNGKTYVVISKSEGVVYKRVLNEIEHSFLLTLQSDNKMYPDIQLNVDDIMEVWEAVGFISFQLPNPDHGQLSVDQLAHAVFKLQSEVNEIKINIQNPK